MVKKHFWSPSGGYDGTFDGLPTHPRHKRNKPILNGPFPTDKIKKRKINKDTELFNSIIAKYEDLQTQNSDPERYNKIITQLERLINGNVSNNTKARAYRMMGEIYLNNESKNDVLKCFEQALRYNPKVGVKRSYEKLKKENPNNSDILISEKKKMLAKHKEKNLLRNVQKKQEIKIHKQKEDEILVNIKSDKEESILRLEEEKKISRKLYNEKNRELRIKNKQKLATIYRQEAEIRKQKEVKLARKQVDKAKIARKLYNENDLTTEKILKHLEQYDLELSEGITRPKLSKLLGISKSQCKIVLNKLISDGKAYKVYRFLQYSKYRIK